MGNFTNGLFGPPLHGNPNLSVVSANSDLNDILIVCRPTITRSRVPFRACRWHSFSTPDHSVWHLKNLDLSKQVFRDTCDLNSGPAWLLHETLMLYALCS